MKKKAEKSFLKKYSFFIVAILILFTLLIGIRITGNSIESIGPSSETQSCISECMDCVSPGVGCKGNQDECMKKCNAEKPQGEDYSCMEKCVQEGCDEFDFSCQEKNKEKCENECNMIQEPEAKSEEEQCIRDCVELHDPDAECANSPDGETGNSVCQMCAQQCVHLYEGPCLNDEQIREREEECKTCEHCYGESVMGSSGQGWDCIVDIECFDATDEWGDNPGAGEGIVEGTNNFFEGIEEFFTNLFSNDVQEEN